MAVEDYVRFSNEARVGQVLRGTYVFAFPRTTLSCTFPATNSSNDGPLSSVVANEGFVEVEAEAEAAVANERTAILEVRWRSSCTSGGERAEAISLKPT